MKNYYTILGVSEISTFDDIKKAYRALALIHHPDKTNGDKKSEEIFKSVSEAYSILGDKDKRQKYDISRKPKPTRPVFSSFDEFEINFSNKKSSSHHVKSQ